jgi:hypothetical protein
MIILEVFYKLTKRAEGTYIKGHRGVLSDYMCTINDLIKHVCFHRDQLNTKANNEDLANKPIYHLRLCILNCWNKLDEYFAKTDTCPA